MASSVEFEGRNVETAVEAACAELNISKDKLKYKVISHGSTGIFGLVGVKLAKITVLLPKPQKKSVQSEPADKPPPDIKSVDTIEPAVEPVDMDMAGVDGGKPSGNLVETGRAAIEQIVDAITSDTTISVEENSGSLCYHVEGGNSALLIGKHGQTLEAIQYIVDKIVNKHSDDRVRIQIDVERYLEKRRTNLQELAMRMAEKTKMTGKPSTIGQMNAYDRRIVHLLLKEDKMIRIQSIGDGLIRKLVVFPKKNSNSRKRG